VGSGWQEGQGKSWKRGQWWWRNHQWGSGVLVLFSFVEKIKILCFGLIFIQCDVLMYQLFIGGHKTLVFCLDRT